jgi:hypothetical protein
MSNRKRYTLVHELLTATAPPPKTAGTPVYHLDQYHLRRAPNLVTVQLVGIRGHEKRTETITFPLLQDVTDAELVRAAVWFSPHQWTVSSSMNFSQFQNTFSSPLDAHLLTALTHPQKTQSTETHSQPQPPPPDQPTLPDASVFQQHIPWPYPQPGHSQTPDVHTPPPLMGASGKKQGIWHWYKTQTRSVQVSLGCTTIFALLLFYALANTAIGSGNTTLPQATSTPAQQTVVTGDMLTPLPPTPTFTPLPTPTHTPLPAPITTPGPTNTPLPASTTTPGPTATPTPPPPTPTPTPILDTTPPSITITAPVNGTLVHHVTTITITASASDNVGVTKVEFLVSGTVVCTDTSSPYRCNWSVPGKPGVTYTLTARASNAMGNAASKSIQVRSSQ